MPRCSLLTSRGASIRVVGIYADQGEANANDPSDFYGCQLEAMVQEWRSPTGFNNSALPFFLVQLAPYYEPPCTGKQPPPCGIGTNYP